MSSEQGEVIGVRCQHRVATSRSAHDHRGVYRVSGSSSPAQLPRSSGESSVEDFNATTAEKSGEVCVPSPAPCLNQGGRWYHGCHPAADRLV